MSFDVVNMFPSNDNNRGTQAVRNLLDNRSVLNPPTECIVEALEVCLTTVILLYMSLT